MPRDLSTVVLLDLDNDAAHVRSEAALRTAALLVWPYSWLGLALLLCVPLFIRDAVYSFIGQRRYRWFGKRGAHQHDDDAASCPFDASIRQRTLDAHLFQPKVKR